MAERQPAKWVELIPPIGVVERDSTNSVGTTDALVGAAIRLIRQKACDGLTVKQILVALQTSRTHLEGKFKQNVGRSVHDEIDRVKKKRVCQLLRASDHTLSEIAAQTGYYSVSHLSRAFRQTFGLWPGEFRKRARRGESGAERQNRLSFS